MNAKILFLAAMFCFVTVGTNAQTDNDTKDNVVCNVSVLNSIETKEYIIHDERTGDPTKKKVFTSDADGKKMETVVYLWNKNQGWVASQKTEYKYNADNELCKVVNMKWDVARSTWGNKKEQNVLPC